MKRRLEHSRSNHCTVDSLCWKIKKNSSVSTFTFQDFLDNSCSKWLYKHIGPTISVFVRSLWVGRVAKNLVLRSFIVLTCLNNRLVPIFVAILSHYKHMVTSNTYLSTDTITRQAAKEPKSMALSFFDDFFESWELLIMINRGSWLSLYKLGMNKIVKLNGEQKSLFKVFMENIYSWEQ